jgi:cytoskeletal protein RodZ
MTKAQNWMMTALAVVALGVGVLLVSGAVSFAQTDEPTPTPSPSEDTGNEDTPTPSPSDDDSSGEDASPEEDATDDESKGRGCGGGKYLIKEAAAEVLGISEEDLIAGLRDGQSLAQIAETQGMSVEDFRAALLENVTAYLQEELDAGEITQAQFDEKVAELNANIDEIITTEGGVRLHGRGGAPGEEDAETGGVRFRRGVAPNFDA